MKECLVDVLNARDTVLHVFPVPVEDQDGVRNEAECVRQALKATTHLRLVPDAEIKDLHARVHVERGGQLTPVADVLQVRQESRARADECIRTRAYFVWQQDGCPENTAEERWHKACEMERRSTLS